MMPITCARPPRIRSPSSATIEIQDVTSQWGVLAIAGPKSRDVLNEIVKDADPATVLSNKRFPWLSMREIELGMCPVRASALPIPASWGGSCITRWRCRITSGIS